MKTQGTRYSEAEVERALTAVALCGGNAERASELLTADGAGVKARTLRRWKSGHPDLYERVRQEAAPKLKADMAEMHASLAATAGAIEAQAMDRLREHLDADALSGKDLSAAVQRAAVATGIHGDKHLLYSGQPTTIVRRDFGEIKRLLRAKGITIDGHAIEENVPALPAADPDEDAAA